MLGKVSIRKYTYVEADQDELTSDENKDDFVPPTLEKMCTEDQFKQILEQKNFTISRVKLMGQFSSSILNKKPQEPDSWISELELMMIRLKKMSTPIDDEYLMMHIMNNLLSSYDSLIKNLEDRLDSVVDLLATGMNRDKLSEKYEKTKKRKGYKNYESDETNEDKERALFAKTFKGRYHWEVWSQGS